MISAWGISVQQLLIHKPVVMYADMKSRDKVCKCGETDPAKFYEGKSACKACIAKQLREWRNAGPTRVRVTCPVCKTRFVAKQPNAKLCGKPECKSQWAALKKREYRKNGYGGKDCAC